MAVISKPYLIALFKILDQFFAALLLHFFPHLTALFGFFDCTTLTIVAASLLTEELEV